MKFLTKYAIYLVSPLFLISCSSDDGGGGTDMNAAVIGTWDMIELNVSPDQDIDNDGTANSNLFDELNCVSGTLIFRDDNTWSLSFNGVNITSITGGLFDIRCSNFTSSSNGTWQLQNNQLTLFQGFTSIFYTLNDNRLTNVIGEDLPEFRSEVYEKR